MIEADALLRSMSEADLRAAYLRLDQRIAALEGAATFVSKATRQSCVEACESVAAELERRLHG